MRTLVAMLFSAFILPSIATAASAKSALKQIGEFVIPEANQGADFKYVESWVLPKAILDKFEAMSNSGGSWGPDGFLYLTGHDPADKMRLPKAGSVLELVEVIPMNIRGQGIAWDRTDRGVIYGIIRATNKEKAAGGNHKVTIFRLIDAP